MGVIYILTNPSFPEYVKLGYADKLSDRLNSLNQSECIPYAFRVYAVYEVGNRLKDLDLHNLIDTLNPELRTIDEFNGKQRKREFYAMSPEDAYKILNCIARISGTEDKLKRTNPRGHEITDAEKAAEITDVSKGNIDISQNGKDQIEYWTAFHEYIKKHEEELSFNKEFTAMRQPYPECWFTLSLGTSNYHLEILRLKNKGLVVAQISANNETYDKLFEYKDEIEEEYELKLEWNKKENRKSQCIGVSKNVNLLNKNEWDSHFEWITKNLLILKNIVIKYSKINKEI